MNRSIGGIKPESAPRIASAPPTLRYGPAGDSAPTLQLKALVWPKGSLPAY